jgi:glycosyltransferase involved in cell wall biosynthesis
VIVGHVGVTVFPPLLSRRGGAIQRRVVELARAQRAAGHRVIAVSVGDRTESRVQHLEFQARAVEVLLRQGVELIHFHSQPEGALLVRGRVPTVLSYDFFQFRGAAGRVLHHFYRRALARFDQLLPCSQYCRETSLRFWSLPEAATQVLYNGVDVEQFAPDPEAGRRLRGLLGLRGCVLVYVGRVCEQKGTDLLLDAHARLRRRWPDLELVVAGPIGQFDQRADPQRWRERMARAGVRYLGPVDEAELAGVYNLADIFVMPTREHEMFGMAAVEAQACGRPVVASDHGGLRETVPEGCGLRFEPGSAASLVSALEQLIGDEGARRRCGLEARRHAARFCWTEIARQTGAVYEMAVSIHRPRAAGATPPGPLASPPGRPHPPPV